MLAEVTEWVYQIYNLIKMLVSVSIDVLVRQTVVVHFCLSIAVASIFICY